MDRDKGLRRTRAITGGLVVAGLAGTLAVGMAARAADSTESPTTTTTTTTTDSSTAPKNSTTDAPALSSGSDGSGQATSGGS